MKLVGKDGLLQDIKLNLWISDWLGGLPFEWNETLNQLEIKDSKKRQILSFRLGLATLCFILVLIQAFSVLKGSPLMVITHNTMAFAIFLMSLTCEFVNCIQISGVVQLFNGFIRLEQNFSKYFGNKNSGSTKSKTDFFLRGMIYLLTSTGIIVPTVFCLDMFRNPCFPAYIGYWMSNQCEVEKPGYYLRPTWRLVEVLTKLALSLTTFVVWSALISAYTFYLSLEFLVEGNCFRVGIAEFGRWNSFWAAN